MFGMASEIILVGAVTPAFLIAAPFIGYLYFVICDYYLKTTRELKRFGRDSFYGKIFKHLLTVHFNTRFCFKISCVFSFFGNVGWCIRDSSLPCRKSISREKFSKSRFQPPHVVLSDCFESMVIRPYWICRWFSAFVLWFGNYSRNGQFGCRLSRCVWWSDIWIPNKYSFRYK